MPRPTFDELYAEVLNKVQHTAIGDRSAEEQHEHAQDIMDALAEAYRIGYTNGAKWVAQAITSDGVPEVIPSPYERQVNFNEFL